MLTVEIITPDAHVYKGEAVSVSLPTAMGEITVLEHHVPLVALLASGTLVLRTKDSEQLYAVSRGMIEIDGKHVRVLTDIADRADTLEESAIEEAKAKAEELMTQKRSDIEGFAEATGLLERELARLRSVRRLKSTHSKRFPTNNG